MDADGTPVVHKYLDWIVVRRFEQYYSSYVGEVDLRAKRSYNCTQVRVL